MFNSILEEKTQEEIWEPIAILGISMLRQRSPLFRLVFGVISCIAINMHGASGYERVSKYNLISELPDIYIHSESEKIGVTWQNGLVWDKPLIQKFYSILPKAERFVMLDIGAQTGSFSLLAKYFPNSEWYSFEPIQEATHVLKKNLELNDINNVLVFQLACSNFSGKTTLKMPAMHDWGLATIGSNVQRFTTVTERSIECIELDTFVAAHNIARVHFMKIDTEGAELLILRGAQKMIARDHPIILMEYNPINMNQCGVHKEEIDAFLREMGYQWDLVSSEDILCIPIVR